MTFCTSPCFGRYRSFGSLLRAIVDEAETVDGWQRSDRGRSRCALQRPIVRVARTNFAIFFGRLRSCERKTFIGRRRSARLAESRCVRTAKKRARVVLASVVRACVGDYGFAIAGWVLPPDVLIPFECLARRRPMACRSSLTGAAFQRWPDLGYFRQPQG
jgi:hypothetical protein